MTASPGQLLVLYDDDCAFCRRCAGWLQAEPRYVEVDFLAARSEAARELFGTLPWLGEELVVVDEHGHAWVGPAAFIVCLWTTVRWREWSYRLRGPTLSAVASRFFGAVSARRSLLAAMMKRSTCGPGGCAAS